MEKLETLKIRKDECYSGNQQIESMEGVQQLVRLKYLTLSKQIVMQVSTTSKESNNWTNYNSWKHFSSVNQKLNQI